MSDGPLSPVFSPITSPDSSFTSPRKGAEAVESSAARPILFGRRAVGTLRVHDEPEPEPERQPAGELELRFDSPRAEPELDLSAEAEPCSPRRQRWPCIDRALREAKHKGKLVISDRGERGVNQLGVAGAMALGMEVREVVPLVGLTELDLSLTGLQEENGFAQICDSLRTGCFGVGIAKLSLQNNPRLRDGVSSRLSFVALPASLTLKALAIAAGQAGLRAPAVAHRAELRQLRLHRRRHDCHGRRNAPQPQGAL